MGREGGGIKRLEGKHMGSEARGAKRKGKKRKREEKGKEIGEENIDKG